MYYLASLTYRSLLYTLLYLGVPRTVWPCDPHMHTCTGGVACSDVGAVLHARSGVRFELTSLHTASTASVPAADKSVLIKAG